MNRRSATTTKVFVGSLPAEATSEDLRRLFTPYGAIAECDIANRCGFLHLEDKDLAMKAIEELNNTTFMGVRISVEKGRVKPPNRTRGRGGVGGVGPMRGGKDRGGPYSRDGFGRGRGGGFTGREFPGYGEYDYDRSGMGRYDTGYGSEVRPAYDDRRGYMADRGRPYPNGFDRRPPYDDRSYLDNTQRGGYDTRRMPPQAAPGSYDDRRPPMGERRPLMDQQMGPGPRPPPNNFDRNVASDMFSRREAAPKPVERQAHTAAYNPSAGYVSTAPTAYGPTGSTTGAYGGGYGDTRSTASMGYETRGSVQSGGYGDTRGPSATASYTDSRGPPPVATGNMYTDTRGAASSAMGGYGTSAATGGYNNGSGAAYDSYGAARAGSYDSAYPPLPQQRGLTPTNS